MNTTLSPSFCPQGTPRVLKGRLLAHGTSFSWPWRSAQDHRAFSASRGKKPTSLRSQQIIDITLEHVLACLVHYLAGIPISFSACLAVHCSCHPQYTTVSSLPSLLTLYRSMFLCSSTLIWSVVRFPQESQVCFLKGETSYRPVWQSRSRVLGAYGGIDSTHDMGAHTH